MDESKTDKVQYSMKKKNNANNKKEESGSIMTDLAVQNGDAIDKAIDLLHNGDFDSAAQLTEEELQKKQMEICPKMDGLILELIAELERRRKEGKVSAERLFPLLRVAAQKHHGQSLSYLITSLLASIRSEKNQDRKVVSDERSKQHLEEAERLLLFAIPLTYNRRTEKGFEYNIKFSYLLGAVYLDYYPEKRSEGIALWRKAAESGHAEAQACLALSLFKGMHGLKVDISEAVEWWKKASAQQNVMAMSFLAQLYYDGVHTEKNKEEAIRLLQAAIRICPNFIEAHSHLGFIYHNDKNYREAEKCYLVAAKAGDPEAAAELAVYHYNDGKKPNYAEAYRWHLFAAQRGNVASMTKCGIACLVGIGTQVDQKEALRWLKEAARRKHDMALYTLGLVYDEGQCNVPKDLETAKGYYFLAAAQNHVEAMARLGEIYYAQGNLEVAASHLRRAAELGSSSAVTTLAKLYHDGYEDKSLDLEAQKREFRVFSQAAASTVSPCSYSTYRLAVMYRDGIGTEKDIKKAVQLLRKACGGTRGLLSAKFLPPTIIESTESHYQKGEVRSLCKESIPWIASLASEGNKHTVSIARFNVAMIYYNAQPPNYTETLKWLQLSIESEDTNAAALWNLGRLFENGHGVKTDLAEAIKLYRKAIEMGKFGPAFRSLGLLYRDGKILDDPGKANLTESLRLLRLASEYNDPIARVELGRMYHTGLEGVLEKDIVEARRLYEQAAVDNDWGQACLALGLMYRDGDGVKKNDREAVVWLKKAAGKAITQAHVAIAEMWYKGAFGDDAVENLQMAGRWCSAAVQLHDTEAMVFLAELYLKGHILVDEDDESTKTDENDDDADADEQEGNDSKSSPKNKEKVAPKTNLIAIADGLAWALFWSARAKERGNKKAIELHQKTMKAIRGEKPVVPFAIAGLLVGSVVGFLTARYLVARNES